MSPKRGQGTKVGPGEKRRYDQLRAAGWSPETAAEAIRRSKSWAYQYEAEKHKDATEPIEPTPSRNLSEAVDLIIKIKTLEDQEPAFEIVDRFGVSMLLFVADVAWFLATERAGNLTNDLYDLLDESPMADELSAQPITARDILEKIPVTLDRFHAGQDVTKDWMPERAEEWVKRLVEESPDLQELEAELDAIEGMEERDKLREMRRRIWSTPPPDAVDGQEPA